MSEFKGTKGKWEVSEANDNSGLHYIQSSVRNALVARTCYMPLSKANALLISKGPEMLEMLIDIRDTLENGDTPHVYKIDELIKSATVTKINKMENKEIFKVGDAVYQWQYGKGKVTRTYDNGGFPIVVKFSSGFITTFTADGRYSTGQEPCLSLTPYDLVNGGFSQERPLPDIEVDTLVYVRGKITEEWKMRFFSHFGEDGVMRCFSWQQKSAETKLTTTWAEWSLTNPLEEK